MPHILLNVPRQERARRHSGQKMGCRCCISFAAWDFVEFRLEFFPIFCYNNFVITQGALEEGGRECMSSYFDIVTVVMANVAATVIANIISYYVCKWLDRNGRK